MGSSPWGHKELAMTEHTHTQSCHVPLPLHTEPPPPSTHPPERCVYAFAIVGHTWIPT